MPWAVIGIVRVLAQEEAECMPAVATLKLHHWIQRQFGIEEPTEWKTSRFYPVYDPLAGSNELRGGQYERLAPGPFTMFPSDVRAHLFKADKLGFNHWHYVKLGMLSFIVIRPAISLKCRSRGRRTVESRRVLRRLYLGLIKSSRPSR